MSERSPLQKSLLYKSDCEDVSISAVIIGESVWLSQKAMAELFDCSIDNVLLHLKNIYAEGELDEGSTSEGSSTVQIEGSRHVRRKVRLYDLDRHRETAEPAPNF